MLFIGAASIPIMGFVDFALQNAYKPYFGTSYVVPVRPFPPRRTVLLLADPGVLYRGFRLAVTRNTLVPNARD